MKFFWGLSFGLLLVGCGGTTSEDAEKVGDEGEAGTWLVGWYGGMNHFSWLRLEKDGTARFLDGVALPFNYPYWECNGVGHWVSSALPGAIVIYFPDACNLGFESLKFSNIAPVKEGHPKGAIEHATIESPDHPSLEGYRFSDTQCNADLTSCTDPFQ